MLKLTTLHHVMEMVMLNLIQKFGESSYFCIIYRKHRIETIFLASDYYEKHVITYCGSYPNSPDTTGIIAISNMTHTQLHSSQLHWLILRT